MATLEKVKKEGINELVNEKQVELLFNNPSTKIVNITGNELFELQQAVQKTLSTSVSIKGESVRFLLDNLTLFDPVVIPLVEEHGKVIKEFVSKKEDGSPERNENGFVFENEDLKKEYDKYSEEIWGKTIILYVRTTNVDKFDKMDFNMKENNTVYLILKWLINN